MAFDAGTLKGYMTLDDTPYRTALIQSQKKTETFAKSIEKNSEKIKDMGKKFSIAGGIITAGFGAMIFSASKLGDTFNKMSIRTGASTQMLSALRFAAEQSGASLEIVEKGFTRLAKNMFDSTLGLAEAQRGFQSLGITVVDNNGKLKETDEIFLQIAEKFKLMEDGAEKSAIANTIFGRSGVMLIPILNQGREGIEKLSEEARKLGITFTTEDAQAAANLTDDINSLKKGFEGLFKSISVQMMPILSSIAKSITGVITQISAWTQEHPVLTRVIFTTVGALGALLLVTGPVLIALPKIAAGFVMIKGAAETLYLRFLYLKDSLPSIAANLGKLAAAGTAFFLGWKAGKIIDDFLGLSKAIQKGIDAIQPGIVWFEKLSAIKMGFTDHAKQALIFRDSLVELARDVDKNVTGLRAASITIKNNKEAYEKLSPELKKIVDGMTQLRPAIKGVIDAGAEIPKQTKEQRAALEEILETSEMKIKELTLSETDFKIAQLNREFQKNMELLSANNATKLQIQTLERSHNLELQKIRQDSFLVEMEEAAKRQDEEKKARETAFQTELESWQTHVDYIEAIRAEQQGVILANIEERDGWRAAELLRVEQWELDQKTLLYNRLQDQKITFQQYQEELIAMKQLGEDKREAIENEARKREEKAEKEKEEKLFENFETLTAKRQALLAKYFTFISNLNTVFTALRESQLNSWYDKEKAQILNSNMTNEERTAAIEALDSRMHQKKAALEAQAQKREKAMAIAQAIANTAVAVTTALKSLPWPLNLPAIAFAIATGAAQIASIGGAYKAPGLESFAPGGAEGGDTGGGGGGGIETSSAPRRGIEKFQTGTNGYITPPRDFIVGDPYSPERVQLGGNLQNVGMSVTPLGQTAPAVGGVNINLDFSGMSVIDATDFENRVRKFLPALMRQYFLNGLVNVPRGRIK